MHRKKHGVEFDAFGDLFSAMGNIRGTGNNHRTKKKNLTACKCNWKAVMNKLPN